MLAKILKHVGAHSLAIFACLIMVVPFYLIVTNSFKTKADASSMSAALPASLHPENFATVISTGKLATSFLTVCYTLPAQRSSGHSVQPWLPLSFRGIDLVSIVSCIFLSFWELLCRQTILH